MTKRQIMEKIPFKLLAVFLLLSAGISAGGFVFYKHQRTRSVAHIQDDLNVIAQLKSEEITAWRGERYGDAFVITRSQQFAASVRRWYKNPGDKKLKDYIYKRLDAFRIYETYKDVILVDPTGKARMFIDQGGSETLSQATLDIVNQAERQNKIIFSDFYYCEKCREVHLDVITPLHDGETNAGALILRINPNKFLYPLIQRWPSVSKSGETILLRREGDEVVHLNELRRQKGTAVKLRIPLKDTLLPAVMAAMGREGMVEGHDYRGVPVVAVIKQIADSPWYMVVKVDKEEIYAPIKRQARNILIVIILGIILLAAVLSFIWQTDRRGFYKKQFQLELEKQALVKHFDYLTKYANDIILLSDERYNLIEVNDRACQAYGYSREELLKMNALALRADETRPQFKGQIEEMIRQGGMVYETVYKRKDGSTFPVESSARPIEIEGKKYLQGIVRDITERKQFEQKIQDRTEELEATNEHLMASEEELKAADEEMRHNIEELQRSRDELLASKARFSHLFQGINSGVAVYRAVDDGADFVFEDFNPAGQKIEQTTKDQAIGKKVTEVFPGIKSMGLFEVFQRVWRTGNPEHYPVSMYKDDHLEGWRENYVYKLPSGEIVAVYDDLTEQKKAEIALENSEAKLRRFYESEMLGVIYWNTEGVITDANDKFLEMTGYSREDLTAGRVDWVNMTPPEFRYLDENSLAELKSSGYNKAPFEKEYIRKDGTRVPILLAGAMVDEARMNGVAFVLDITERKRAEEELKKTQELLENAYRLAHIGAWSWAAETDTVTWTVELYIIAGRDPNMPAPKYAEHPTLYTPESWDRLKAAVEKAMATGAEYQLELELIRPDGTTRWINTFGGATKNGQGNIIGLFGTVQDITERKEGEDKLKESEKYLKESQQIAHLGHWHLNVATNQVVWSEELYKMYGFDPLLPPPPYTEHMKLFTPESWERLSTALANTRETGVAYELELVTARKDGSNGWIWVRGEAEVDPGGKIIGLWGAAQDITERKRIEQDNLRLLELLDNAANAVTVHDLNGRFIYANRSSYEILGYTREEHLALNLSQIDMPESAALIDARMDEMKSKRQAAFEVRHRKKDGTAVPMMVSAKMAVWQGQPVILSIATDITARKQAEEHIRQQLAELHRWQATILEREDRVLDLKKEINELLAKQGQPKKYGAG